MRRTLPGGYELDDDRERVDLDAVHDYLANHSYWAAGRAREVVARSIRDAARVVGLYDDERQIGFCRVHSDGIAVAYLADVYVLPEYRGRGLGVELVREAVDNGPHSHLKWMLHTEDAHALYAKLGFGPPDPKAMERPRMGS